MVADLWQHQKNALVNFGRKNFLYAGMSSGKTMIALWWLRGMPGLQLIVTPKAAMNVYVEDNEKFFGGELDITVLDKGTSRDKRNLLDTVNKGIVVVNYETARLLPLDDYRWNAAVLDECHKIGTRNSAVTLALTRMLEDVPFKLAMTGTPYHDGYEKLYSIFRWLDGYQPHSQRAHPLSRHFGHFDTFLDEYCITHEMPNRGYIRIIDGYKNIDRLQSKIAPMTTIINTEDVIDLPELVTIRVPVELSKATRKKYKTLAKHSVVQVDDRMIFAPHQLTKLLRLSQITNSGQIVDEYGLVAEEVDIQSRVDALEGLLDQLGGKPAVIFTRFQEDQRIVLRAVIRVLGSKSKARMLNGHLDETDEWRKGEGQVLIANISAGAAGLRLERASHIIFWSLGFGHAEHQQALARCRRHGQEASTVYSYEIVALDTVDEHVYNTLHAKEVHTERLDAALAHRSVTNA